jgi:four helix bundle protein
MDEPRRKVECFEDLIIWRKGIEFAKASYLVTERKGLGNDFGLKGQIRDAAVSIPTNIAEGFERRSRKEYINFLNIAKASAGESRSLLYVAFEIGYLEQPEHIDRREKAKFLSGSIANHMRSIGNAER